MWAWSKGEVLLKATFGVPSLQQNLARINACTAWPALLKPGMRGREFSKEQNLIVGMNQ
jgi:hypothetical protein